MNCWKALRAKQPQRSGKPQARRLENAWIGQSAAKGLGSLEPTDVFSQAFDFDNLILGQGMSPTGHDLVALDRGFSLTSLAEKERIDSQKEVVSVRVVENNLVCGFAGRKDSGLDAPLRCASDEFDSFSLAHRNFHDDAELKAMRCFVLGGELADSDATLTIDYSGDVRSNSLVHGASWSTFNDYGESQYAQAGGSARALFKKRKVREIVFSARERAAVLKGRFRTCVPKRKHKAYTNDDYIGIAWPSTLRTLKNNLETIHQYTVPGIQLIFNAEIGRYENVRFIEQTNIPKGISSDGGLTGTAWTGAASDWIFFMGEDTVAEGVAIPEEMRAKIPTDFGRSKGVAWYYLGGFGLVQTAASEARVVMWDSAA